MGNPFDTFDAPVAKKNPFDAFDAGIDAPAAPGFVPTVKRTAGQMLTGAATTIEDITGPNAVTSGMRETGKGIIERNPAGIQSLSDVVESPWLTVKEAVGNMVPQIGTGIAGRIAGAQIGARLGGQAAGGRGALIGGIAGGLAPVFVQEYGGIRDEQKEGGQESIPRALGAAAGATALEMLGPEGRIAAKGVNAFSRTGKQIAKQAGRDALVEGGTEAAQSAVEQVGAFKDPLTAKNLEESALSGVLGAVGGGVVGGAHAAVGSLASQRKGDVTADAPAEPAAEAPAAPADPAAIRAQKLPETGPLSGAVNAGVEAEARAAEPALSQDDLAAAQFYVEQRRNDGTPAGQDFAAQFDAGRISPHEALRLFDLERAKPFELPQPAVDAQEIPLGDAAARAAQATAAEPIPVGQATDLGPLEVAEGAQSPESPQPARAPRSTRAEGQQIDPAGPNAVRAFIDNLRTVNTPAARAYVQDFDAGRVTPQEVMQRIAPAPAPAADASLAAAAAQAKTVQPGDLLTSDGKPYPILSAAKLRQRRDGGTVIEVADGYVVRPKAADVQRPDVAEPAGPLSGAAAQGLGDAGGGAGGVGTGAVVGDGTADADAVPPGAGGAPDLARGSAAADAALTPIEPTNSLARTASWVIREKGTGEVVMETFDKKKVDALNTEKYEAVPIQEHLASLNRSNSEQRPATPVAESQTPAPSEPGDRGVAPTQEGAAPSPKARWLKAVADHNRLNGGMLTGLVNGRLNYDGDPRLTKPGRALIGTVDEAQRAGASLAEIAEAAAGKGRQSLNAEPPASKPAAPEPTPSGRNTPEGSAPAKPALSPREVSRIKKQIAALQALRDCIAA